MNWKESESNKFINHSIFQIHGTNDFIIPFYKKENKNTSQFLVKNGGHFMILTHAEEVNNYIERILDNV